MRVDFGMIITGGHGKAGSQIVQQSYGGFQLRNLVQPLKNPRYSQSLQRKRFQSGTKLWRGLSSLERDTWNTAAAPGQSGFELFCKTNLPLLTIGQSTLNSYVAPVGPPNVSQFDNVVLAYDGPPVSVGGIWERNSGNQSIPTAPWFPSFLWTGWIPGSQYKYPRISKYLPVYNSPEPANSVFFFWNELQPENPTPQDTGYKCKFTERWINSSTGEQLVLGTYEVVYGDSYSIGAPYYAGPQLVSAVLSGSAPNYVLTTQWTNGGSNFDPTNWRASFFMNSWSDNTTASISPQTIVINDVAADITGPHNMTIVFDGVYPNPPNPTISGTWISLGFNWENTVTFEKSFDSFILLQAANYP